MILTFSSQVEAADGERRVISGKIVPYEAVGHTSVGPVVFAKDSIEIGDPGKVKMLMQHRPEKPIGRMQRFNKAEDGIYASFKISASMQGQDALILASEQLVDGLSVGVDVNKSIQKKDYLYVTSATLREVSLVESPAFGENAGLVANESSAAVTYSFESSLPRAALILCSVYAAIEVIGVRIVVWISGAVIIGRAASTVGVAASAFASCGCVALSSTGASLSFG